MTLASKLRLAALVACVGWVVVMVAWHPAPYAITFDDAFYYLTIGRNLAHGHGSTFDLIDRTNGYHPLWQAICVVPYWLGLGDDGAVRALLALQVALWAATLWFVLGDVARRVAGWPRLVAASAGTRRAADAVVVAVTVLLVANPFLLKMVANGLESGVEVPVLAVVLLRGAAVRGRFVSEATRGSRLLTGCVLGLAFLARTDAVLLFAPLGLWCLLDAGTATPVPVATRVVRTAELFVVPALVVGPYLLFNQAKFDTALQISGVVKRVDLTAPRLLLSAVWVAVAVAVVVACRKAPSKRSQVLRVRRFLRSTGWFAAFCVLLLGYYSTLQEVPYLWYFCPLALYGAWVLLLFLADLVEGSLAPAREGADAPTVAATPRAFAPALIVALPLLVGLGWQARQFVDPGARALLVHDAEAGRWMRSHLLPGTRAASWDAGAIGYYSHLPVVNLDGVVNSKAWYDAMRHGRTAAFLADRRVLVVVNHGGDVGGRDPDILKAVDAYFGKGASARLHLLHRWLFEYSGSLDGSRTDTSSKRMGTYVYTFAVG